MEWLLIVLLATSPQGAPGAPEVSPPVAAPLPPPGEMARLKALVDAGNLEAARARLAPLAEQHPRWARAVALLALTYYKENRFERARALFARALELDPGEVAVLPFYGWSLYSLGELDEARRVFEALLSEKPDFLLAHYGLGLIHLDRAEVGEARAHFETTLTLATAAADLDIRARAEARLGELARRRETAAPATGRAALGAAGVTTLRFQPVPDAAGLDLVMTSGGMPSREILEVNGGGIALLDYDGDGDLDVFLANGATLEDPQHGPGSRLYANRGDGTFDDVSARVGLRLQRWAMGVAVGDYDGDGWDDLYVTCFGANALLRNEEGEGGGRRFRDVAAEVGVVDPRWSTSAAFADLDGDSDLDLYVVNYLHFDPAQPPARAGKRYKGVPVMAGPRGLHAQPDSLYENLGDGRFREVTAAAGIAINTAISEDSGLDYGLSVRIFDFDGDGRPDIFVGNDSTADQLYRNLGGLRFEEIGALAGVATNGAGITQATMGLGLADADGNGAFDLFLTVFSDDTNTLHANRADGTFEDHSAELGLAAPSRPSLGWGCGFYDFDLDGDEDLFIANGHVYPEMDDPEVGESWAQRPLLFKRRGERFEVASCAEAWCERRYHGRATAFGDLDGDLDVDILMTTLNGPPLVLRNEAAGASLVVRLAGPPGNPHALGSRVEVENAGIIQRRLVTGGGSFQSVDATDASLGLGAAETTATVRVIAPDGKTRLIRNLPTGNLFVMP